MFKKILTSFITCVFLLTSGAASAVDLGSALDSLGGAAVSVNTPGRYQSGARNVMTAGGVEMRVPPQKNNAQLFSVTPPKIEAGCGGVSAFFGGFSFMSGKEFEQLLKNIASGAAMGFVSHLAMKVLCPYCESVAEFLQRINQVAGKASQDSCRWGQQMAKSFQSSSGLPNAFGFEAECKSISPQAGKGKDYADAEGSLCKTAFDAVAQLESWVGTERDKVSSDADKDKVEAAAKARVQLGNGMWTATGRMFPNSVAQPDILIFRTWLMNLTGTTLVGTATSCGGATPENSGNGKELPRMSCPGTGGNMVTAEDVQHLLLCGSGIPMPPKAEHASITQYCIENNKLSNAKATGPRDSRMVMVCDPSKADALTNCSHIMMVQVKDAKVGGADLIKGTGLMYQVRDLLGEAVTRVVQNKSMYDPTAANGDPVGQKIIRLIQLAPYPLYQAINAAAVYPGAALDMIDSMSVLIGESMANSYIDEYLRMAGRSDVGAVIDEGAVNRVNAALEAMRAKNEARRTLIVQNMTIQETLNANIRQINQAIQRQVMTSDVMNGNKFTATVGGSVMGATSGKGTAPAN